MEGDLVTESSSNKRSRVNPGSAPLLSYSEAFVRQFPFYLALGMTYDQYWNEDCTLVKAYREAYEMRREEKNYDLWLQGLYIYSALCSASPLFRFSTKPQKAHPYLEEPFSATKKETERREQVKERQRYEKIKAKMEAMVGKTRPKEVEKNGPG